MNAGIPQIICAVVLFLAFITPHVQGQKADHNASETRKLNTKLEIAGKEYCIRRAEFFYIPDTKSTKVSTHYKKVGELHLQLKLSITNTGTVPIIIDKSGLDIASINITEKVKDDAESKVVSNIRYYHMPHFVALDMAYPEEPWFAILKPNETYISKLKNNFAFDINDSAKLKEGVLLKYLFVTWGGQTGTGDKIRNRWSKFGYLWLNTITTDSVLFKIERSGRLPNCKYE